MDIISIKAQLSKAFHIIPSEIEKMPFWEFELYMKELEKLVKEEAEHQKAELDKSGAKKAMSMANPSNMQNFMKNSPFKMPDMGKFNMSMPSTFKMPSFK